MKLKLKINLLMTAIFVVFMLITWYLSEQLMDKVNQRWGEQFAAQQVQFDKYRTLSPLIREIGKARQMAADPSIIAMALHEQDAKVRARGIATLEHYRLEFRERNYFAAFAGTGDYFFNDANDLYKGKQLRYVLSPNHNADKWFYATLQQGKDYQVNLDPDVHLNLTKIWINVLIKSGNQILGVVGTGLDLEAFLKETVSNTHPGISNLFIDGSMAIQLYNDVKLIDYMTIAKDEGMRSKVDVLLTNPEDVRELKLLMEKLAATPGSSASMWVDFRGQRQLMGVSYLPEIGWYDLTLLPKPQLQLIANLGLLPMLFVGAFLLALLAMAAALRRWVLNPVASLQNSIDQLQQGNFEVTVPSRNSSVEMNELSRSFVRMAGYVRDTKLGLEATVKARTEELLRLTEVDPLTGLLNRRGMTARFEEEIARQSRLGGTLGLLLLDLDYFKVINDRYGHAAGDLALCEVARMIGSNKRGYDHAARWGGEEFLVLLPDYPRDDLLIVAER